MEAAYDHIQEEAYPQEGEVKQSRQPEPGTLTTDLQDAYATFAKSAWGTRLGGMWGSVRKSVNEVLQDDKPKTAQKTEESTSKTETQELSQADQATERPTSPSSLGLSDILNNDLVTRFKSEASKRLKDIEKAEDAADEALVRFGSNLATFFKDAISVTAPSESANTNTADKSLPKRGIATSRYEARLMAMQASSEGFTSTLDGQDASAFETWKTSSGFDTEKETDKISAELERYPGLRITMEDLVPEKVTYKDFWTRYFFMKAALEAEEKRRKELLKNASSNTDAEEHVSWSDDEEDEKTHTPQAQESSPPRIEVTIPAPSTPKPRPSSDDKPSTKTGHDVASQAGSEESYDILSGNVSRAPGSPKTDAVDEEEEDWE